MAIIILKGADFSANNIGQITLPEEMHEFTKKIFSHCTKYSIYSEQASLVNDFISYLDSEGLLDHLGLFMAPWLSSDVNEATYNIAGDTQLQYAEGVTLVDGVLKTDNVSNHRVTIGENVVPAVNFIGAICSDKIQGWTYAFSKASSNGMTLLATNVISTMISKSFNPGTAYGYKPSFSNWSGAAYGLFNIKGLSNLDTNGTTFNGVSVTPNTGYDKSGEPLSAPNGLETLSPSIVDGIKQIFFAGDGTNLTDAQVTSMMTAITTLQTGLAALEE